ncbi:MAG: hypothetical protein A3C30_01585 [Candidatus Levybacteria bacterium RIFCSPHIGHO2_02_FULL_40_18]|nr:MAG: hypothetical protein A2869_01150 [Candidatus Levybacteria bacterium RIFCSPHIGHO2_01_FULL_40_58]OGH26685.1 MAG: hypothetical protein A3C30_01585 [Candidatus Levybacteria bacterium RIFCSPHIGHO2_02_FULL_40_18]OGH31620.1 MAG: hypothetical protein A3E43_01305 [Candidatus Levybacteria bacterium RIFCSPHIGHO2_12_FULL_40_31]OGH40248.1 MAG: hypothetical protein A2894_02320 [Candidatus Levybacteria bacterium RIFCSPLOWO2_01_FULL_40_64]OGH49488.1 MAG: hypothetical protein A3I54_05370 [Candidatus Lev
MTTSREAGGAPDGAQNFRARSIYPVEFAHVGEWGVTYPPYDLLEDIGFSLERVAEERENRELAGEVIVVAGVSEKGIGEATAIEIARQGGIPVCVSRKSGNDPEVLRILDRIKKAGAPSVAWMQADLTINEQRRRIIPGTISAFGKVDGLALVAAKIDDKAFTDYTDEEIDNMISLNASSHTKLARDFCEVLNTSKKGRVVEFSSLAEAGSVGQGVYPGTKAYLNSMARSLGAEYALRFIRDRDANVAFSSIVIDYVPETHMTAYLRDAKNRRKEERIRNLTKSERELRPGEVGAVAAHLLNPRTDANSKVVSISGRGRIIGE